MESFRIGIFCLFGISLSAGVKPIHETQDAIHQVGYNYPSWSSPGTWHHEPSEQPEQQQKQQNSGVTILDQYHRVSPDGAVEFKLALSDGQVNHQKIYNKIVNGTSVQVFDGYYSVLLSDGTYRTTYYRADENGYRLLGYMDTMPSKTMRIEEIEEMAQSGRKPL